MNDISEITNDYLEKLDNFIVAKANSFELKHGRPEKRKEISKYIKTVVKNKSGIYIYYLCDSNKVLYIGKAKSLYSRIKCHYEESVFEPINGKKGLAGDKKGLYPAFFNKKYNGAKVKIVWIEVQDEWRRRLIEAALHLTPKPSFLDFKEHEFNQNQ